MIIAPFVIAVDTREQKPWKFNHITVSHKSIQTLVKVATVRQTLYQGDYSISGLEGEIAIERKSIPDACSSFLRGRKRFVAELDRLRSYKFSAVLIEGTWTDLLNYAAAETQILPASLDSSVLGLTLRYPTQWIFRPSRFTAEKTCYKLFELFFRYQKSNV